MTWLSPILISFYRHVTRPRAVAAWAILVATVAIDLRVGGETVHEMVAVVIGVLMSFVLLPDPAGDVDRAVARASLWLQEPKLLTAVVTVPELRTAAKSLLEAIQPSRGALAWHNGAAPILDAPPEAIYDDFNYSITMWPGSNGAEGWYLVETSCSAVRTYATDQKQLWASFVRSVPALEAEFAHYSCLSREIVPASAWEKAREMNWLGASLRAGNRELTGVVEERDHVMRVVFDLLVPAGRDIRLTVRSRFLLPLSDQSFPVQMESYYCRGRTQIDFDLRDPDVCDVDAFVSAPGLRASSTNLLQQLQGGPRGVQSWRILTPPETLLFPGSGVMWRWRHDR